MNKKLKCQVCGKPPQSMGVNSCPDLVICEPCDRHNNPYYYDERPPQKGYMMAVSYLLRESITPNAITYDSYARFSCSFMPNDTRQLLEVMVLELGDITVQAVCESERWIEGSDVWEYIYSFQGLKS